MRRLELLDLLDANEALCQLSYIPTERTGRTGRGHRRLPSSKARGAAGVDEASREALGVSLPPRGQANGPGLPCSRAKGGSSRRSGRCALQESLSLSCAQGCSDTMTVRANDIALGDLGQDFSERRALSSHGRNVDRLGSSDVVKVHGLWRKRSSAVHAWPRFSFDDCLSDQRAEFFHARSISHPALRPVFLVPFSLISSQTSVAARVPRRPSAEGESLDGLFGPALSADLCVHERPRSLARSEENREGSSADYEAKLGVGNTKYRRRCLSGLASMARQAGIEPATS